MPLLMDDTMETLNTNSNYQFSAIKIDELGSSEYTLATILVDTSSSLFGQEKELENMVKAAVEACQHDNNPRSENMMLRLVSFNDFETEEHGFKPINTINLDDYTGLIKTNGMTLLYDSTCNAIEATSNYGDVLFKQDYLANGIIFIITDGMDNRSSFGPVQVKNLIEKIRKSEQLDSIAIILIGIAADVRVQKYLTDFKNDGELDKYIEMGEVTPQKLAKLAGYISKSISSTSQVLGTGGKSKSLSF